MWIQSNRLTTGKIICIRRILEKNWNKKGDSIGYLYILVQPTIR